MPHQPQTEGGRDKQKESFYSPLYPALYMFTFPSRTGTGFRSIWMFIPTKTSCPNLHVTAMDIYECWNFIFDQETRTGL